MTMNQRTLSNSTTQRFLRGIKISLLVSFLVLMAGFLPVASFRDGGSLVGVLLEAILLPLLLAIPFYSLPFLFAPSFPNRERARQEFVTLVGLLPVLWFFSPLFPPHPGGQVPISLAWFQGLSLASFPLFHAWWMRRLLGKIRRPRGFWIGLEEGLFLSLLVLLCYSGFSRSWSFSPVSIPLALGLGLNGAIFKGLVGSWEWGGWKHLKTFFKGMGIPLWAWLLAGGPLLLLIFFLNYRAWTKGGWEVVQKEGKFLAVLLGVGFLVYLHLGLRKYLRRKVFPG